ncbi:MAG: hypothetical protein IJ806_08990 [Ruminococcus sp.]|nr:hypothetical protein [Ruminococcus sp.]
MRKLRDLSRKGRPDNYDPARDDPQEVYGPPEMFGISGEESPQQQVPECIYGPPEMLDGNRPERLVRPENENPQKIYGPPEMLFGGNSAAAGRNTQNEEKKGDEDE